MPTPESTFQQTPATSQALKDRWNAHMARLAYQNKTAEWVAISLFISGLLLWEVIPIDWAVARWSLVFHLLVGLLIFPLTTGLFWLAHRRLMLTSNKAFLRKTGRMLDIIIGVCFISGLTLTFLGDTGNRPASLTCDTHWLSGLILGPVMLAHAWRYSAIRFPN